MSVFIVAEAGVNHLGDRAKMLALCDAAKAAGADAVKFQAYDAMALADRRGLLHHGQMVSLETGVGDGGDWIAPKREHQETVDLLKAAELSDADLDAIAAHCKAIGIKWGASVFDTRQVGRVVSRGAAFLKVGHAEFDWFELTHFLSATSNPECTRPASVPVYVSVPHTAKVPDEDWGGVWGMSGIKRVLCVSEYPAKSPPGLGSVGAIKTYSDVDWVGSDDPDDDGSVGVDVVRSWQPFHGFSSHYTDYRIPAAAALRGAEYIEAHIKLGTTIGIGYPDKETEPESAWSLSLDDFAKMVKLIREYETWL